MKIKISNIIIFAFVAISVLVYNMFYLFSYNQLFLSGYVFHIWVALLAVAIYIFILITQRRIISKYGGYIHLYLLAVFLSIAATTVYAALHYSSQSLYDSFCISCRFLWVFWAIPLIYVFERKDGYQGFMQILNVIALLWLIITIAQAFLYKATGNFAFKFENYLDVYGLSDKGGAFIRIVMGAFGNFFLAYNALQLFQRENRRFYKFQILYCALGCFHLLFIQQTRVYTLIFLLCLGVIIFWGSKITLKQIIITALVLLCVGYIITSGKLEEFLNSFSATGEYSNSTVSRAEGIKYYWDYFLKNPVWSMGFAHSKYYEILIHGQKGLFFLDDVGFIGTLTQLGLFIIPVYILPVGRMIYIYIVKKSCFSLFEKKLVFMIIVYIVASSVTLIITDIQRIILFPVLIGIVEYINGRYKINSKKPHKILVPKSSKICK